MDEVSCQQWEKVGVEILCCVSYIYSNMSYSE